MDFCGGRAVWWRIHPLTLTLMGGSPSHAVSARALEKVRAIHMTMKERLRIHKEIVESNKRKLKEWKERRKSA